MNIKEELDKLRNTRDEIAARITKDKVSMTNLNSTIKQLEKLSGKVTELIEDSPVIELGSVETLREVTKGLV